MKFPRSLAPSLVATVSIGLFSSVATAHESTVQEVVALDDGSAEARLALGLLALDPANRLQILGRSEEPGQEEAATPESATEAEANPENEEAGNEEAETEEQADPDHRPAWLPPNGRAKWFSWDGSADELGERFASLERHDGGHHHHHGHRHSHSHGRGFDSRHRGRLLWFGDFTVLTEALSGESRLASMWREVVLCGSTKADEESWAALRATGITVVLALPAEGTPDPVLAEATDPESAEGARDGEETKDLVEEVDGEPVLDREELLLSIDTPAARWYRQSYGEGSQSSVAAELAALWLVEPESAEVVAVEGVEGVLRLEGGGDAVLLPALGKVLAGISPRETSVWRGFPGAASLRDDVAALAPEIVQRHGEEEWRSVSLAAEWHRELDVYAVIGAKMGVRARELLDAGLGDLTVTARTGRRLPLAALCDGLQAASGASLGRGGITVNDPARGRTARAEAEFLGESRRLQLRLRPEIQKGIDEALAAAEEGEETDQPEAGTGTAAAKRALALRHWLELDRGEIFEEEWLRR